MGDTFFTHWFQGLSQALTEVDDAALDTLMTRCGQGCSDSFSKQVYIDQYRTADDLDDFLEKLNQAFGDMDARRLDEDTIEINYTYCTCDLVRKGYITDPRLCLCSLKSLQYNWETVLGEGSVACRMEQSILRGDKHCRFIVTLL
ncbi:MAG TPA: hypothetical protein PK537_07085 [Candidatus Limiplasma sp.]|nr:hypothetical protein [Candidatus Limiplasma sp.]